MWFHLFLCCLQFTIASSIVDSFPHTVLFTNIGVNPMSIYWVDQSTTFPQYHIMFTLNGTSSTSVNTLDGHSFLGVTLLDYIDSMSKTKSTKSMEDSSEIEISPNIDVYLFGKSPDRITGDQFRLPETVKIIGLGTSKNGGLYGYSNGEFKRPVKIRTLMPNVSMYLEDRNEGIFLVTLMETGHKMAMSSYNGHSFFFTNPTNKSDIYGRILISKSKVYFTSLPLY